MRAIADAIKRSPSTVSRELRRNAAPQADTGHRGSPRRRAAAPPSPTHQTRRSSGAAGWVKDSLAQRWSPSQISRTLRRSSRPPRLAPLTGDHLSGAVSTQELAATRPAPSPLSTGRDHRHAHMRLPRRRRRFEEPMLSVHQRPFPPEDRSQPGHWEGDVIVGPQHRSAIGTLVERQVARQTIHLPGPTRSSCVTACCASWPDCPPGCSSRSPGIRAARWPVTSRSPPPPMPRCIFRCRQSVAARHQRKHQRAIAPILSERHRPLPAQPCRSRASRTRTQ